MRDHSNGPEMAIAQGGTNVSGGQRQRLCIARTIVDKRQIYVFDDSFSALDMATDANLRAALLPQLCEATVVIVAQRVQSIRMPTRFLCWRRGGLLRVAPTMSWWNPHQCMQKSCVRRWRCKHEPAEATKKSWNCKTK